MSPVWLITAASSGFGKGIALEALARGYTVVATARNSSKLSELASKGAITANLDVTHDLEKLKAIVADLHAQVGRFDVFVNAAGYILEGALEEASPQETSDCFNTNVLGILNATRAVLPYMRQQRSGNIALFGSVGSWRGGPAAGIYCATKWAVSGLAESLRPEVEPFGIGVCVIEPGYFRTGFLNDSARVRTQQRIKDYDESAVGDVRAFLDKADNNQPGDLQKGVKVIVDVFSLATVKEVPLRLVLGSDARAAIAEKCTSTLRYLEDEKVVIDGTDYSEESEVM